MQTQVHYFERLQDYPIIPGRCATILQLDPATFGGVEWRTVYAAVTHPLRSRLEVVAPPLPAFRACVYDVIARFIGLPFPPLSEAEQTALQALPCGFRLADFRQHWPNPLPEIEYDWKRLNYYLGLYDWQPSAVEYIHPELDRPLVAEELSAIETNRAVAAERMARFCCGLRPVADESYSDDNGQLLYNLTHETRALPISNYRALRKSKRWLHPFRIELV